MQINSTKNVLSQNSPLFQKNRNTYPGVSNNNQDRFGNSTAVSTSLISSHAVANFMNLNSLKAINFMGYKTPQIETQPVLEMRVTGVTNFQDNLASSEDDKKKMEDMDQSYNQMSINKLDRSDWKDGDELSFEIEGESKKKIMESDDDDKPKIKKSKGKKKIVLYSKQFGEIGRVPDEIAPRIMPLLSAEPENFKFELSNLIAGKTKGASTIGLRVNLIYTGSSPNLQDKARNAFNDVLNDPNAAKKVLIYQSMTTPSENLDIILAQEEKENGIESARKMEKTVHSIAKEIDNPKNHNILIVGHCKPDGDTIGSILGLKHAIDLVHPGRNVDCSIDDELTGLFRHKLPGIDESIRKPYSEDKIDLLRRELKAKKATYTDYSEIKDLEDALAAAKDKKNHLSVDKKYDLVILMDIPTPSRFSSGYKDYIENANKVIYIDHHPFREDEWDKAMDKTGIDMSKISKNNLAWIAERVPAATQMATIIASKLAPGSNPMDSRVGTQSLSPKEKMLINGMAASFVTGMSTDTGGFTRTANLIPSDIEDENGKKHPVQSRPNFYPEGMSKWLFDLTDGAIDKKWLRDEITYDIVGKGREQMIEDLIKNQQSFKEVGLGCIKASYDDLQDILKTEKTIDNQPETKFLDVANAMKYSEIMSELENSLEEKRGGELLLEEEVGPFDKDKIAVFVSESEREGEINTEGKKSTADALRFSFRSKEGTIHSELIATLFNGGGHGNAAGGHLRGHNVDLNTTFSVEIDGEKVTDSRKIYSAVKDNYDILNDRELSTEEKKELRKKVELVKDSEGQLPTEIIQDFVGQIRLNSIPESVEKPKKKHK